MKCPYLVTEQEESQAEFSLFLNRKYKITPEKLIELTAEFNK